MDGKQEIYNDLLLVLNILGTRQESEIIHWHNYYIDIIIRVLHNSPAISFYTAGKMTALTNKSVQSFMQYRHSACIDWYPTVCECTFIVLFWAGLTHAHTVPCTVSVAIESCRGERKRVHVHGSTWSLSCCLASL